MIFAPDIDLRRGLDLHELRSILDLSNTRRQRSTRRHRNERLCVGGWVNALIAAAASAIYIAAECHLPWPEPADSAVSIAGAIVLCAITALVALALVGVTVWRKHPWSWSLSAVPVLMPAAIGVAAAGQPHFHQYWTESDTVAQHLPREREDPSTDAIVNVGRILVLAHFP